MADGDIVRNRLPRCYQKPYKWLCERKASSTECAWVMMNALKQDLKKKGDLPIVLAQCISEKLSKAVNNGSGNWNSLGMAFERLVQQVDGSHYQKELILRASKSYLQALRYGQATELQNAPEVILQHYVREVYESGFREAIPLISEHHDGINEAMLNSRIEEMQPDIDLAINGWAKKAVVDGTFANIRLPSRPRMSQVDMDEDLLVG